ncbi:MAG: hypothetical protein FJ403_01200 [Verrucomicrobia bacterium]|nr:hypothetical protein [Verrucomicrobiota bacterium]
MKPISDTDPPNAPLRPVRDHALTTLIQRHLRFGWWSLLVFLSLGIALESFHGFKKGFYLDVPNETRRLMWTLAHAHGTFLSLVHIAFGATISLIPLWETRFRDLASGCLMGATILVPAGFFVGGIIFYSGDPGLGIVLVPLGAVLLFVSVLLTARGAESLRKPESAPGQIESKKKEKAKPARSS